MLTKSDHVYDTDENASKKLIQYPYEAVPILTIAIARSAYRGQLFANVIDREQSFARGLRNSFS